MKAPIQSKHPNAAQRILVLLVDDHPAVREGLAVLLAPEGIVVSGEAAGRAEALAHLQKRRPDVAIVDLSLDGEDGVTLIADLRERGVAALVYSMHNDARHVEGAFAAGALGYVTKREFHGVLVEAIRGVAARRPFVSPGAAAALAEGIAGSFANDGVERLSPHERKVYDLLGHGADTFEIAAALRISNHTVESYYARILIKLGLDNMHELRRHAIAHLHEQTA